MAAAGLLSMETLSNQEIEDCRLAFEKFDKDGSGSISDWELRAMLQCAFCSISIKNSPATCSHALPPRSRTFASRAGGPRLWTNLLVARARPRCLDCCLTVRSAFWLSAVAAMGQDPSDEELFDMIAAVDDDGSAEIGAHATSSSLVSRSVLAHTSASLCSCCCFCRRCCGCCSTLAC